MWIRDQSEGLFVDEDFTDWYPADGRSGLSPAQLALVSVLQFAENLTDRQAAQALACRIGWKYCLGLELDAPGFDYSVPCEFRDRMAEGDRADRLLAVMVDRLVAASGAGGGARTPRMCWRRWARCRGRSWWVRRCGWRWRNWRPLLRTGWPVS